MEPKISIIIPVYNAEHYLSICLDSIVKQTMKDIEVILVNDGSTDNSGNIANQYAVKYPYFIVVHKEKNQGTLLARKTGIDIALGKYIVFIDADDYLLLDTTLETMYSEMESRKVDILQFPCIVGEDSDDVATRDRVSKYVYKFKNKKQKSTDDIIISAFIYETISCFLWSKMFRTKLLKKASQYINPVRMIWAEDTYIFLLVSAFSQFYEYVDCEPLYCYRLNEKGESCKDKLMTKQQFYNDSCLPIFNSLDKLLENPLFSNNLFIHQACSLMKIRFMNHLSKKSSV